jgi:ATP-binding cassette subfamily B protein
VREYKRVALLSPALIIVEVIMDVLLPRFMARIVDDGIGAASMGGIAKYGALLFFCALASLVTGVYSARYASVASAGFAKNLRRDMYYKTQDFAFSNLDRFSSSGLVTRLTTDVTNVQNAFMMILRITVRAPFMLISALIMAFSIHKSLSLVFLGAAPLLIAGLALMMTRAYPVFQKVFKTYDRLNRVVQENLRGIRIVKNYVREDYEIKKFNDVSGEIYDRFSQAEKILFFNAPLMQFCLYGCTLLLSWLGARFIVAENLTTGELMSLLSYAFQILMSLMMISMVFVMLTISRASAQRISEVLAEESDLKNADSPVSHIADGSVSFENVGFSYAGDEGKLALRNVSLDIKSGQVIGIIGGTGSSKSTLVQLIPRLYDVTSGVVKVGGVDVRDCELRSLRDAVAMVLQKNELFSGTIKDNLRWGDKNATDQELVRACELAQADSFIRELPDGYDTVIDQGGTNVSGGQKQRLCIARALLKKPKILILDDSTSAVDTKTDSLIRSAFAEIIPDTTKIIIAQRVASVENADMIIVLDDGAVNDTGTHLELMARNDIYREIYTSQTKGGGEGGAA